MHRTGSVQPGLGSAMKSGGTQENMLGVVDMS